MAAAQERRACDARAGIHCLSTAHHAVSSPYFAALTCEAEVGVVRHPLGNRMILVSFFPLESRAWLAATPYAAAQSQ